jgi:hypothetical protein
VKKLQGFEDIKAIHQSTTTTMGHNNHQPPWVTTITTITTTTMGGVESKETHNKASTLQEAKLHGKRKLKTHVT